MPDSVEKSTARAGSRTSLPGTNRACDHCKRRKARCHLSTNEDKCARCCKLDLECTFDIPVAKRGPKAKTWRVTVAGRRIPPPPPSDDDPPELNVAEVALDSAAELATPNSVSSSVPWDAAGNLVVDPALSPPAIRSSISEQASITGPSALQRWHELSRAPCFRGVGLERTISRCFDLFFEYLYPLTPLVHEPSLRDAVSFFTGQTSTPVFSPGGGLSLAKPDAAFTLITAVCAETAFLLPKNLFPEGSALADTFLQASRNCLNGYLETDLESPSANSIAIRYFHSNCVHAAGKPKYSWHIFGEATRLAQVMQLNEESTFEGLSPLEAELRRRVFWICFMGDKSASILNNRPITIHRYSFEAGITTAYPTGIEDESHVVFSPNSAVTVIDSNRRTFIDGFNANLRLWQAASEIILEMRLLRDQSERTLTLEGNPPFSISEDRNRLDSLYIQFVTCLDDLPPYLQSYTFPSATDNGTVNTQKNQFVIQRANLQISFHCLRMVITQKFEDLGYFGPGSEQADLRKTEIARDMLCVLREAPFWVMQVNGEPYVEKIRLIGASLLAIIHRNGDSPLAARARSDFTVLLDVLTRLDSKASDALRSNSASVF